MRWVQIVSEEEFTNLRKEFFNQICTAAQTKYEYKVNGNVMTEKSLGGALSLVVQMSIMLQKRVLYCQLNQKN